MVVEVKEKLEKTIHVKINGKYKKCILREKRNVRQYKRNLSKSREQQVVFK